MASLGKLFVFLNLIAAVGLAAWAFSLTQNRLDWVEKPEGFSDANEDPRANDTNNLARLTNKISRLNEGIKSAQNGVAAKSAFALAAEAEQAARANALALRIRDARTGRFRSLVYRTNSGLLDLTLNNGADVLGIDSKPLQGLDAIQRAITESVTTQAAIVKESVGLRTQYEGLTVEVGDLDTEIDRQKVIRANALAEAEYLADRGTDWDEQIRTLERGMKKLADRLAELKAAPKKDANGKVSINNR